MSLFLIILQPQNSEAILMIFIMNIQVNDIQKLSNSSFN